ncbi:MAG: capsule assembly Wzi family protein [Terracidiphilus sp.]
MSVSKRPGIAFVISSAILLAGLFSFNPAPLAAETPGIGEGAAQLPSDASRPAPVCEPSALDSPYIPVDSWVYPAVLRLYGLGYIDTVFLGMRPWTRASLEHILEQAGARIDDAQDSNDPALDQAQQIYEALDRELHPDMQGPCGSLRGKARVESVYSTIRPITGTPLNDSFHLGQTVINDYGRPYENGFNNYTGASGYASAGRFTAYARAELQFAPSAAGYSTLLAQTLSGVDNVPFIDPATGLPLDQPTIPMGPIGSIARARVLEAYVSANVLNNEISFGKQDAWLGPGLGGSFAYSNNAENIYSFRINRVEPLHIPGLSYITGPFTYDFLVGPLQGHTAPADPWVHVEKIAFRPTENLEFGFSRTVIWGGKGHVPITLHSFLRSFFSVANVSGAEKNSRDDPGARFGTFDFSYRLPFLRNWLTLYTDGEVHDDISPIDAPRRASWRPGLYLSHVPGLPKLDIRAEAVYTDPPVSTSVSGRFMYWEVIQVQGYTNNGLLFGDWVGREDKGGQGWITYHLSGNEWLQVGVRNQKAAKDFIPGSTTITRPGTPYLIEGGTTINDINFQAVKRIGKDFEINGNFTLEHWKAPIYLPGEQTVTTTSIKLTWYPERKASF